MAKPEMTEKEIIEFLRDLGIKEEGIRAILETYPLGTQRHNFKRLVESRMEGDNRLAKEAVWRTWRGLHFPQVVHQRPVGKEPTESDFLLL